MTIVRTLKTLTLAFTFFIVFNLNGQENNIRILKYEGLASNVSVYDLDLDRNNQLWACTDIGVYKINSFSNKARSYSDNARASALAISRKNQPWTILSNKEVHNLETGETITIEDANFKTTDIAYYEGKLWVGSTNGIYVYNASNLKKIKHYTAENSKLESNNINFLFSDSQDILWIGTDKGIARIDDKKWKVYEKDLKMFAVFENIEGIWLVSEKEVWVIDQNNRWYPAGYRELIKGSVRDITIDQKGKIYIASEVLTRFDPYTNETKMYGAELGLLAKQCLSLLCDRNNQVWIGTENAGLFKIGFQDTAVEELTVAAIVQNQLKCNGGNEGRIKVNVSGGKKPYKYKWQNRALAGSNPGGLKAGIYELTVTDQVGNEFLTAVEIVEPSAIQIEVVSTTRVSDNAAKDGKAEITVSGGKADYSVIWPNDKSEGFTSTRLGAGKQKVKVIDADGCIAVKEFTIDKAKFIPDLDLAKIKVGQTLRINELYFDADSSVITKVSHPVLDEIFTFLKDNENVVIEIGGHTNNIPSHEYCDQLSSSRARNVAAYLFDKGISSERIAYKGYGKRNPIATNLTDSGRKKNQRVEIKILSVN